MPILGEEHTPPNYEYVLISVQNTIGITCVNVCVKQEVVGGRKLCPQGSGTLRQQYTLLYSVILFDTLLRGVSMCLLGTLAFA